MGRYDMPCISSYRGTIQSKKRTSKFIQPIQPTTPPNVPYNSHACSRVLRSCLAPHFLSPLRQPTSEVHKSTTASQHLVAGGSKIDCPWCPLPFCAQVLLETVLFCIGCFCSLSGVVLSAVGRRPLRYQLCPTSQQKKPTSSHSPSFPLFLCTAHVLCCCRVVTQAEMGHQPCYTLTLDLGMRHLS